MISNSSYLRPIPMIYDCCWSSSLECSELTSSSYKTLISHQVCNISIFYFWWVPTLNFDSIGFGDYFKENLQLYKYRFDSRGLRLRVKGKIQDLCVQNSIWKTGSVSLLDWLRLKFLFMLDFISFPFDSKKIQSNVSHDKKDVMNIIK